MKPAIDTSDTKHIRKAIKAEYGYNARQLSVRSHVYSMGETIHFTVRDPKVSYAKVREIASRCEDVMRCKVSGEVLNGGNTYTDIHFTEEVIQAWSEPLVAPIKEAFSEAEMDGGGVRVKGFHLVAWRDRQGLHLTGSSELDMNAWRTPYSPESEYGFTMMAARAWMNYGEAVLA